MALLFAVPAHAQDQGNFSYRTPEYSGPMAVIDMGGMERAGSPTIVHAPWPPRDTANDRGYEREVSQRKKMISSEMDRRREEARLRAYDAVRVNE